MKLNVRPKVEPIYTHEGARAVRIDAERILRRSVMSCMLWEDEFYEDGQGISERIADLVPKCRPEFVAACAYEARTRMKLRHVPLLLVREMARLPQHKALVGRLLPDVIQRADEIAEFLAIYWKEDTGPRKIVDAVRKTHGKKQPLSKQVKLGLSRAFHKFSEFQFAKYDRDGSVKLRDAMFLTHPRPHDEEQEVLFKKIAERELAIPDTWEVQLSAGADKRETFMRLMDENKLGALAFLRNLRNMAKADVPSAFVQAYAHNVKVDRVLPFRFIAAARAVPEWEHIIEPLMFRCLEGQPKFPGITALLIDGSASMADKVSAKSDISRRDAAIALGILLRELCEDVRIFGFSSECWTIPARRGFALSDAVNARVIAAGTLLGRAVRQVNAHCQPQRVIVITDEQSRDQPPAPLGKGYVINVASARNGVGYGAWTHIDGWSEAVIDYIRESESAE